MRRLGLGLAPQHAATQWWPDGAAFAFNFAAGEAMVANARVSAADLLVFERAGPALAPQKPGGLIGFATNEARITNRGLLVEDGRTNLLLHSFSPASQSATLAAGSYVLSLLGAGQVDLGVPVTGNATANMPLTFTLDQQETVTITPAGDVRFFQLETGAFPTSPIATDSEPASRASETVRLADPSLFDPHACTVLVEWEQVAPGTLADSGVQTLLRWEPVGGIWSRMRSGSTVIAQVQQAGGGLVFNDGAGTTAAPGIHRTALALAPNDMAFAWSASVDGAGGVAVDVDGTPAAEPLSVYLGGTPTGERLNGWIRKIVYWPERLTNDGLLALSQGHT